MDPAAQSFLFDPPIDPTHWPAPSPPATAAAHQLYYPHPANSFALIEPAGEHAHQLAQHASHDAPTLADSGRLTRQRARQQQQQQELAQAAPLALHAHDASTARRDAPRFDLYSSYQHMMIPTASPPAFHSGAHPQHNLGLTPMSAPVPPPQQQPGQPQLQHGSPPPTMFPGTPTTASSGSGSSSSRLVSHFSGRSASPAASIASTSLTSISGGGTRKQPAPASRGPGHVSEIGPVGYYSLSGQTTPPDILQMPARADDDDDDDGIPGGVKRPRHRKQRLYNIDRKAICLYAQGNPDARQEDIAARYGVERSTISKILKNKDKWLNVREGDDMRIIKHRPSKFPALEKRLVLWLRECSRNNQAITDSIIRTQAKAIAAEMGIGDDKFKASSGWIENFKHRQGVRRGMLLGRPKTRRYRSDGELVTPDCSEDDDRVMPGEEGLLHAERLDLRARKKEERMALWRIAERLIDTEHEADLSAGRLPANRRTELIALRRAKLLAQRRAGKPLDTRMLDPEEEKYAFTYQDWLSEITARDAQAQQHADINNALATLRNQPGDIITPEERAMLDDLAARRARLEPPEPPDTPTPDGMPAARTNRVVIHDYHDMGTEF